MINKSLTRYSGGMSVIDGRKIRRYRSGRWKGVTQGAVPQAHRDGGKKNDNVLCVGLRLVVLPMPGCSHYGTVRWSQGPCPDSRDERNPVDR